MIVVRGARPERDFTIVANAVLRDERLSYRARGILCFALSFPDNFQVSSERLSASGKEGRDAIRSCLNELESFGYLKRERRRNNLGQWEFVSVVYDTPVVENEVAPGPENPSPVDPASENPEPEKPAPVHPASGFPGDKKNTDKEDQKKKQEAPAKIEFTSAGFVNLSDEQIALWTEAYPAVNVKAELAKARAWLDANPKNRKSDYKRFLNGWLSRAQDKAPRVNAGPQPIRRPQPRHNFDQIDYSAGVSPDGRF